MTQFYILTLVSALMIMSPGPDFAVVVKNSLSYGRMTGLYSALGIAIAVLCHVSINLLGIGVVIAKSVLLFTVMKVLGAAYLIYLGIKGVLTKSVLSKVQDEFEVQLQGQVAAKASEDLLLKKTSVIANPGKKGFYSGLLCCLLNPKACLFFLSFFSVILSPHTDLSIQIFYGAWISFMTLLWFGLVAIFFTSPGIAKKITSGKHWLERFTGGILILLGVKLISSEVAL